MPKNNIRTSYTWKATTDFYDWVMPDIPGFVPALVDQKLRDTMIDFCARALLWRQTLPPVGIVKGNDQYNLSLPQNTTLADILEAKLSSGVYIDPINRQDVRADAERSATTMPTGAFRTMNLGKTRGMLMWDDQYITFNPIPDQNDTATIIAALKPTRSATKFPSFLYERWMDGIASGTIARLQLMNGKRWSNPELGELNMSTYETWVARAANSFGMGRVRRPTRTRAVDGVE